MAHAYFAVGNIERALEGARAFGKEVLGKPIIGNPDFIVQQHGLFTVDDARRLMDICQGAPTTGSQKIVVVSATRIFHEAQNALLKLFEEPPQGVTLVLLIPAEGVLLPTLRSRLVELPFTMEKGSGEQDAPTGTQTEFTQAFISATSAEREKLISKLIERTKSDKDEEKQAARNDAVLLLEVIIQHYTPKFRGAKNSAEREALGAFLADVQHFLPLLHTRSAPLKLMLEHIRLTWPKI